MSEKKPKFDPDQIDRICETMTPHEFGVRLARHFVAEPEPQNYFLMGRFIEQMAGGQPDFAVSDERIDKLIDRVASWPPDPFAYQAGLTAIAFERGRQVMDEGFGAEHDDAHDEGELATAAMCYALAAVMIAGGQPDEVLAAGTIPVVWPFDAGSWKPSADPVRNLEKAGALIAAEIDRIKRQGEGGEP